jgi:hypothetical protein
MPLKKFNNKIPRLIFSILIINLLIWNLSLAPQKVMAACDPKTERCYSCDPKTGSCFRDDTNGTYSCSIRCNADCAGESASEEITTNPLTSSCSGGGGDAYPVYIVGSSEQQAASQAASQSINSLEDLAKITGLADQIRKDLINKINAGGPIPDEYKDFAIGVIERSNLSSNDKKTLIDIINKGLFIPEELQDKFASVIQEVKDITELVSSKFLDVIMSGFDIDWICEQLTTAAAALPWGIGAAVAQAVAMACPVVLNNVLSSVGFYESKEQHTGIKQIIPVPRFDYYQWEVGLPGFIKAGDIIKFK